MILTDRDRRLISLWLAGWKTESIATELGMHHAKVRFRAREIGLPKHAVRNFNLWPYIVAWAKRGHDAMAIARGIKCTRPEVVAGCDIGLFQVKQPKPVLAIRSKASKRAWATRKRQIAARQAAMAEAESGKEAA